MQDINEAERNLSAMRNRWLTPDPDPEPLEHCDKCGDGIYIGDIVWEIDGDVYCDECAKEMYSKVMED